MLFLLLSRHFNIRYCESNTSKFLNLWKCFLRILSKIEGLILQRLVGMAKIFHFRFWLNFFYPDLHWRCDEGNSSKIIWLSNSKSSSISVERRKGELLLSVHLLISLYIYIYIFSGYDLSIAEIFSKMLKAVWLPF